jgi:hypothetical protein
MVLQAVLMTSFVVIGLAVGFAMSRPTNSHSFSSGREKQNYTKRKVHELDDEIKKLKRDWTNAGTTKEREIIQKEIDKREKKVEGLIQIRSISKTYKFDKKNIEDAPISYLLQAVRELDKRKHRPNNRY